VARSRWILTAEAQQACPLRFVVIDTITTLYQDKLNTSTSAKFHASMVALVRRLRATACSPDPMTILVRVVSALPCVRSQPTLARQ
jgi:hypothetical protein